MRRYASPGGGSKIYNELTTHWTNNPAIGVRNGQSLAKNDDQGRIPSRPSSWTTLPWVNTAAKLFPQADNAITRLSTYGFYCPYPGQGVLDRETHIPFQRLDRRYSGKRVLWEPISVPSNPDTYYDKARTHAVTLPLYKISVFDTAPK